METKRNPDRDRLARVAAVVGIVAGIAAVIGVAYAILNQPNTEVADYQRSVLATCENVQKILAEPHMEVVVLKPGQLTVMAQRGPYVNVLKGKLERARLAFGTQNNKPVPASLQQLAQSAKSAQDSWYLAAEQVIADIEAVNAKTVEAMNLTQEFSATVAAAQLDAAMTALAGSACNVTGPIQQS